MQSNIDYTMLYRIAKYYYQDKLSQSEIAQREHLSRPHISRLLDKARECGIVQINIVFPEEMQSSKIRKELIEGLGIEDALIAFVPGETKPSSAKISMNIATAAAQKLPSLLKGCKTVGVGWGRTVYETSRQLPFSDENGKATFVPLIGISGEDSPYLQINTILDRFAEKFGAESFYTNIPAIRENDIKLSEIEEMRYARLQQYWDKLDAAVIGLGIPPQEGKFLISEVSQEYKQMMARSNTIGDILCQFFYADGRVIDFKSYYEQFSFPVHKLRYIDKVICLAGGEAKVEGIITAARNGFYKTLVTDNVTAKMILDRL